METDLQKIIDKNLIFISTTKADMQECAKIAELLRKNELYYWTMHGYEDPSWGYNLPSGDEYEALKNFTYQDNISGAQQKSCVHMILLSPNIFVQNPNTGLDFSEPVAEELKRFKKIHDVDPHITLVPVILYDEKKFDPLNTDFAPARREVAEDTTYSRDDIIKALQKYMGDSKCCVATAFFSHFGKSAEDSETLIRIIMRHVKKYERKKVKDYLKTLNDADIFLELQNIAIQGNHLTKRVSDYILSSGEISSNYDYSEIHILSNELQHYDATIFAKLAIAMNVQCGTKYIYYIADKNSETVYNNQIKTDVKHFMKRDEVALSLLDTWIRNRISEELHLSAFLESEFTGPFLNDMAEYYAELKNVVDEETQKTKYAIVMESLEKIYKRATQHSRSWKRQFVGWLDESMPKDAMLDTFLIEIKKIYDTIDSISYMEKPKHYKVVDYQKNFSWLLKLDKFSTMLVGGNRDSDDEFDFALLDDVLDDDIIPNISKIRDYLTDGNEDFHSMGNTILEESEIDEMVEKNIIAIDISQEQTIKKCYSFCIYIEKENKNISTAWYTCRSNAHIGTQRNFLDEYIVVNAFQKNQETNMLLNAFSKMFSRCKSIKDQLEENKSFLIDICNSYVRE